MKAHILVVCFCSETEESLCISKSENSQGIWISQKVLAWLLPSLKVPTEQGLATTPTANPTVKTKTG